MEELKQDFDTVYPFKLDKIFVESFDSFEELDNLLADLKVGDTVILPRLGVLGQSTKRMKKVIQKFARLQVQLIVLEEGVDTSLVEYSRYYKILIGFINSNNRVKSQENKQKFKRLKEAGVPIGRPKVSQATINRIHFLRRSKGWTYRAIAEDCDVSIGTVNKYLKRGKQATS